MRKIAILIPAVALFGLLTGCSQESAPVTEAAPAAATEAEAAVQDAAAVAGEAPVEAGETLASGDPQAGQRIYIMCQ